MLRVKASRTPSRKLNWLTGQVPFEALLLMSHRNCGVAKDTICFTINYSSYGACDRTCRQPTRRTPLQEACDTHGECEAVQCSRFTALLPSWLMFHTIYIRFRRLALPFRSSWSHAGVVTRFSRRRFHSIFRAADVPATC